MKILKYYLRKLYHLIAFLGLFLFFIVPVKADTIINIQYGGSGYSELHYLNTLPWQSCVTNSCTAENSPTDAFNTLYGLYLQSGKQYYSMYVDIKPNSSTNNGISTVELHALFFDFTSSDTYTQDVFSSGGANDPINRFIYYKGSSSSNLMAIVLSGWSDPYSNNFYLYYDSNFNFINNGDYIFKGFFDNENDNYNNMLQVSDGEPLPKIKDLMQYNSWSDYENNNLANYTTVNLDNYEYVLLSLKNYNQTQPFQTSLQVKGQIGITPIYNYGQTSKDSITGSQVQDRCNLSYSNFTSYPFYVIQSDLQNNAIYAVKSCTSNSSFKFDNTIFDVTYVTASNKDNPTITIGGQTYNVIPYSDLPSSATENEENNYIPGQSGSATDTGGLDSAIKTAQDSLSSIWSTFNYFTQFVGQIFSSLPEPLQGILLSAFTISIVLGLIKLFVH